MKKFVKLLKKLREEIIVIELGVLAVLTMIMLVLMSGLYPILAMSIALLIGVLLIALCTE